METVEKTMTPEQSLKVIEQMINSTKSHLAKQDSLMYLTWGWLVFIAAIMQFSLIKLGTDLNYLPWVIFMPLGGIISIILGVKKKKDEKVKTHVNQFLMYLWIAFGVTLGIIIFYASKLGPINIYPLIIAIYGVGTFVSGGALKFKPLIIGGIICWILSIIAFWVGFEIQLLLLAVSVLVSYIIPGYALKNKFKNDQI